MTDVVSRFDFRSVEEVRKEKKCAVALALVLLRFLSQSFDLECPSNNCSLVVEVPPQRVYYTALELPLGRVEIGVFN